MNIQRKTITNIGAGMVSEDLFNYKNWKIVTIFFGCLSVLGIPLIITAVALNRPMLALVTPVSALAFVIARRERNELSKMLKIRFESAMNLHCGPDDVPYKYDRATI